LQTEHNPQQICGLRLSTQRGAQFSDRTATADR